MKEVYARFARLFSTLSFPIKGLFIHNSQRVRVIIVSNQQVLLTKSAIGSQKWSLPGGGIEKGESYTHACAREVQEETGIRLHSPLIALGHMRLPAQKRWPVATIHFYSTHTPEMTKPCIIRPLEILDVQWFSLNKLPDNISPTVAAGLKLYRSVDRS